MFVKAGAHYVALDFIAIKEAGGHLGVMAAQVRRGIAWVYKNAASFGGDPDRVYIGGHSCGGHLCGVALTTDWQKKFGLPQRHSEGRVVHELACMRWHRSRVCSVCDPKLKRFVTVLAHSPKEVPSRPLS